MGNQVLCLHGVAIGECPAPGCPIWLGAPDGRVPWAEGWALSTYSAGGRHDTRVGDLVHEAKYGRVDYAERLAAATELADRMVAFLGDVYERPELPFSACLTPPTHGSSPFALAPYLCGRIAEDLAIDDVSHLIAERFPVPSVKSVEGLDQRLQTLFATFTVTAHPDDREARSFLIIDDVYETGATARAICSVLASHFRRSTFYLLCAACRC